MIDDGKMLNYIRQNVEMGIDGIDQISDHIHSREMNDVIGVLKDKQGGAGADACPAGIEPIAEKSQ